MKKDVVPTPDKNKKEDNSYIFLLILVGVIGISLLLVLSKLFFDF